MRKPLLVALLATALAAPAVAEPLVLDQIELDHVTAGSGDWGLDFDVSKYVHLNDMRYLDIWARLDVKPDIKGNTANAEAGGRAVGPNTYTDAVAMTDAVEGYFSQSYAGSVASTVGAYHHGTRPPSPPCCDPKH